MRHLRMLLWPLLSKLQERSARRIAPIYNQCCELLNPGETFAKLRRSHKGSVRRCNSVVPPKGASPSARLSQAFEKLMETLRRRHGSKKADKRDQKPSLFGMSTFKRDGDLRYSAAASTSRQF